MNTFLSRWFGTFSLFPSKSLADRPKGAGKSRLAKTLEALGIQFPEHDRPRFFATLGIFFLIAFIYDILRSTKISLVISGQDAGAEIIPFISIWGILPASFILTFIFTYLSTKLRIEKVFYIMCSIFLGFFLLFITVLYPNREILELTRLGDFLQTHLPSGMKGMVSMVRHWHYTLFYIFGELWGNIVLNMLFWGFVNETTMFSEAKRYYIIFITGANIAPIFSSRFCLAFRGKDWTESLNIYVAAILVAGLLIFLLFSYVSSSIEKTNLKAKKKRDPSEQGPSSLMDCFQHLRSSKYLSYITIIVLSYYVLYNFTDVLWSDQMALRFKGDTGAMNEYMNKVSMFKGILATIFGFFVSGKIIQRFGWYPAAMVTPVVFAVTCAIFFSCVAFEGGTWVEAMLASFSFPLMNFVVLIGSIQHCLIRASKFSVFDTTKEMAFTPLDRATQRIGKAVIDGVGGRLGKSGGALIFQVLLYTLGSLSLTIPYVAIITIIILGAWIIAVGLLKKEIEAKVSEPI